MNGRSPLDCARTIEPWVARLKQGILVEWIDLQKHSLPEVRVMTAAISSTELRRKSRVLVAEDDADVRDYLVSALREIDIDVDIATDGGRLLVAVASKYRAGSAAPPIDLIVLDVTMPVCSGLAVLEALRSARWTTPVLVITGHETPLIRATTDRLKATLMNKPIDLTIFQQTVQRLLSERPAPCE